MSPNVHPLTSVTAGLRPCSCFADRILTIDPWALRTGLDSMMGPFRAPRSHQHSPGAANKQWYPPPGHCRPGALLPLSLPKICVDKRSLPLQRTPLCPETFCWLKEQMWCRQQQCQLPPALTWREQLNKRRRWFSPTDFSILQPFS